MISPTTPRGGKIAVVRCGRGYRYLLQTPASVSQGNNKIDENPPVMRTEVGRTEMDPEDGHRQTERKEGSNTARSTGEGEGNTKRLQRVSSIGAWAGHRSRAHRGCFGGHSMPFPQTPPSPWQFRRPEMLLLEAKVRARAPVQGPQRSF